MRRLLIGLLVLFGSPLAFATVTTQTISVTYTCTNSTGPFPFTFSASAPAALTVTQNGILLLSSAYTVTPVNNNLDNGGSINLVSVCPAGQKLVITRVTPLTQTTVFSDNMPVPMSSFENGLDKLTEISQEQAVDLAALANDLALATCPAGQSLQSVLGPICVVNQFSTAFCPAGQALQNVNGPVCIAVGGGGGGGGGISPIDYGAVADAQSSPTGSMSSGSSTLNCSGCNFTLADATAHKTISVQSAGGTSGSNQPLTTTIASYNSSTQVVLSATATQNVTAQGVIWGTDSMSAFITWAAALPGNKGHIPSGNYLINASQETVARYLTFGSNEDISMDGGGNIFFVGAAIGPPGGSPLILVPAGTKNLKISGLRITGEWLNTSSANGIALGFGYAGVFGFGSGGDITSNVSIKNSVFQNLLGIAIQDSGSTNFDEVVDYNTFLNNPNEAVNINTTGSSVSNNYMNCCGTFLESDGDHSKYNNNIIENGGGIWIFLLGGRTGGSPYVGSVADGNIVISPNSEFGCFLITDGFTNGSIVNNECLGLTVPGQFGYANIYQGSVATGSNLFEGNSATGTNFGPLGFYISQANGNIYRDNWTNGTINGISLNGSTGNNSTQNSWNALQLTNGSTGRFRDYVIAGPSGFSVVSGSSVSDDTIIWGPSRTIYSGPPPSIFATNVVAPAYLSAGATGSGAAANSPAPTGDGGWWNMEFGSLGSNPNCLKFGEVGVNGGSNQSRTWPCASYNGNYSSDFQVYVAKAGNTVFTPVQTRLGLSLSNNDVGGVNNYVSGFIGGSLHVGVAQRDPGQGDVEYEGVLAGASTTPSGACVNRGWVWALDGTYSYCNGGSYVQPLSAASLAGGGVGSLPYQSAASSTSFVTSPTTNGHVFFPSWSPTGSPVNMGSTDLGSYLGANITATGPIVATPTTLGLNVSCPTCGVSGGGTVVTVNGSGSLGNIDINSTIPSADANFLALTPKLSGSSMITEAPYATGSTFGVVQCGTGITCTGGVITGSSITGATTGQVAIAGGANSITSSIALGTSGSNIPQLSSGLLNASVIPNNAANTSGQAAAITGGAVGSVHQQTAANVTGFIASPTTSGHQFALGWAPSGSPILAASFDLGAFLGINVTGTTPIVATPSTLGVRCPALLAVQLRGGTSVSVNGGSTLGTWNFNATAPVADASFLALTPKISGADTIVEAPYGSASGFGVLECGTGLSCSGGVATTTSAISGMTVSQVAIAGSPTTITSSIALGTTGSNIPQLSSGKLAASIIPNPSASTLGGTESLVATTHQWINTISTSGVPSSTQPAFTDISGNLGTAQGPSSLTGIIKDTAGTLAVASAGTDYQAPIALTTTGTGNATLVGTTLNIPANVVGSSLTSNHLLIGGGSSTINADSGCLTDGAGNATCTTLTTSGTKNGAITLQSTGVGALAETTNQVQLTVPNSVTHYALQLPGSQPATSSTGFLNCTNANPSVCSFSGPTSFTGSLAGDVTGTQSATVVGKINGVSLAGLGTGILKNTTGTGVPSLAASADVISLWLTGVCSSSTFLRGDGQCATPAGSGTVVASPQNQVARFSAAGTAQTLTGSTVQTDDLTTWIYTGTGGASAPLFTATGSANGNLNLTSTAVTPSSAAASTIQLTVPNAVTAYRRTFAGAAPLANAVGVYSSSGVETWQNVGGAGANVVTGPSSSTTNNIVSYADSSGTIKDSGISTASLPVKSQRAVYTNATTTPSTIWSFPIAASQSLAIDCKGLYKAATSGAFVFTATGPASPTTVTYNHHIGQTLSTHTVTYNDYMATGSAYPTGINTTAVGTAATDLPFEIVFQIINGANAGTVAIQGATISTNTLTIEAGSYCTAL